MIKNIALLNYKIINSKLIHKWFNDFDLMCDYLFYFYFFHYCQNLNPEVLILNIKVHQKTWFWMQNVFRNTVARYEEEQNFK